MICQAGSFKSPSNSSRPQVTFHARRHQVFCDLNARVLNNRDLGFKQKCSKVIRNNFCTLFYLP